MLAWSPDVAVPDLQRSLLLRQSGYRDWRIQEMDVAIVTILEEEYKAVRAHLSEPQRLPGPSTDPNVCAWMAGKVAKSDGNGFYRVILALTGRPGTNSAVFATIETVRRWKPRYVLLVGIAGGLPNEGLRIGDVVFSTLIWAYEYGKLTSNRFLPRQDFTYQVDPGLLTASRTLENIWKKKIRTRPPDLSLVPRAIGGPVASGDKIVDSLDNAFFADVFQAWPRLLAVEMEGAGAANAIEGLRSLGFQVGFMMIRGISDMPTINVTNTILRTSTRDRWKEFAAAAAASFAISLIASNWPTVPSDPESVNRKSSHSGFNYGTQASNKLSPEELEDAKLKAELQKLPRAAVRIFRPHNMTELTVPEVKAINDFVAIAVPPELLNAYTEKSFGDTLWQILIREPQDLLKARNHLHYSNALIAQAIHSDMKARQQAGEFAAGHKVIRILETGTGGCNTTNAVLQRLSEEQWDIKNNPTFEYLGIEINEEFANFGNKLFNGTSSWEGSGKPDIRTKLKNDRVRPWNGRRRFIEVGNAPEKIAELVRWIENPKQTSLQSDPDSGVVDYYFCSYMLHHVPNGDALVKYLIGQRDTIHDELADVRQEAEYFGHRLSNYLHDPATYNLVDGIFRSPEEKVLKVADAAAYCLAQYFKMGGNVEKIQDRQLLIKTIPRLMMEARRGDDFSDEAVFNADWMRGYFYDPQTVMLLSIRQLLRPNGLVLIADPDGQSAFNRKNVAKGSKLSAELVLAHFRSLNRICDILRFLRFDIVRSGRVVSVKGSVPFDMTSGSTLTTDFDITDNNLGYFVVARKRADSNKIRSFIH